MTINIGINLKKYVLIAADTRWTYYKTSDPRKVYYKDKKNKIKKTNFGLITGAGRIDILKRVDKDLASKAISNTEEIRNLIKDTIRSLPTYIPQQHIDMTGWMISFPTIEKRKPAVKCSILHPKSDYHLGTICENDIAFIAPIEADMDTAKWIYKTIKDQIKPIDDLSELNDSIAYHCNCIQILLETLSKQYDSICETFTIGVHTIDGRKGISKIINDGKLTLELK